MTNSLSCDAVFDAPRNRILYPDGVSVVSEEQYIRLMVDGKPLDGVFVYGSWESDSYEALTGDRISVEDDHTASVTFNTHTHTEADVDALLSKMLSSVRFTETDVTLARIRTELRFFEKTSNILFLLKVSDLIDRFKNDDVVWGVGRGSGCASYIMYLLEIHDIDPIRYRIPFYELSKEMVDEEEEND